MTKYLSTTFHSIVPRSIGIPNRIRSLLLAKYNSTNVEQCRIGNEDRDDPKEDCDPKQTQQRLLKVAIVGVPNAGKSSLINSIVQRNICPYSCKVHTTRSNSRAVCNEGNTQLVFLDTPGLVDSKEISKYNLDKAFASDSVNAIDEADIIGVIHDVSNRYTRNHLDPKVLRLLHLNENKNAFLVLSKIDLLKSKSYLLDLARSLTCFKHGSFHIPKPYIITPKEESYRAHSSKVQERMLKKKIVQSVGWDKFNDVFMVSSVLDHGTSDIKDYLLQKSKPSSWMFPQDKMTDIEDHELVKRVIESQLYDDLPNEVPYNLKVELEYYETSREGNIHVVVLVYCNTPRIEKLIMGKRGRRVRDIARKSEQALRNMFFTDVFLKIVITNKPK